MKKLLICCLSGETANILAKKMQKIADAQGLNLLISAVGLENVFSVAPAYHAVLVAPHIQYKRDEIANVLQDKQEIAIIESLPYAAFNADSVLKFARVNLSHSLT
ncbi:TPA: PTS cellobiose transporter subunit IIB [Raoultella planticola]|uniref:PTS sugar transporter subunit IIB n=1 Tax=Raoultella planticola TaxID=575 RepID=UPI001A187813|nr:PTS cellobiose transporter subunit IIB [Raoultella planticola]